MRILELDSRSVHLYTRSLPQKRLVIEVSATDHRMLKQKALSQDMSLSNYVRRALGLPEERHGVKKVIKKRVRKGGK